MCDKRNQFCFICGLFVDKKHRFELTKNVTVVQRYNLVFNLKFSKSRWYEPEYACSMCSAALKKCKLKNKNEQYLPFIVPMVWHYQIMHKPEDCYFCQTNTLGHRYNTRHHIRYANVLTVSKPVPHIKAAIIKESENSSECSSSDIKSENNEMISVMPNTERHLITNEEYRDLVRDMGLSSRQTEVLGSRMKQWNLVEHGFKVTFPREKDLISFEKLFKADDVHNKLVYCTDVYELYSSFDHIHQPKDWRLFIDGSCKSKYSII